MRFSCLAQTDLPITLFSAFGNLVTNHRELPNEQRLENIQLLTLSA
jgi:hypothetical protein